MHVYPAIHPAAHQSALAFGHLPDCPSPFFYIAHFDHLILMLALKGVRLVGLITFQVDAVGLPVFSWVRRIGTVRATFKLADRPVLGED